MGEGEEFLNKGRYGLVGSIGEKKGRKSVIVVKLTESMLQAIEACMQEGKGAAKVQFSQDGREGHFEIPGSEEFAFTVRASDMKEQQQVVMKKSQESIFRSVGDGFKSCISVIASITDSYKKTGQRYKEVKEQAIKHSTKLLEESNKTISNCVSSSKFRKGEVKKINNVPCNPYTAKFAKIEQKAVSSTGKTQQKTILEKERMMKRRYSSSGYSSTCSMTSLSSPSPEHPQPAKRKPTNTNRVLTSLFNETGTCNKELRVETSSIQEEAKKSGSEEINKRLSPIKSNGERYEYKCEFERHYPEYLHLHSLLQERVVTYKKLQERLKGVKTTSPEWEKFRKELERETKKNHDDPIHLKKIEKFKNLHTKLGFIKRKVQLYDRSCTF